MLLLRFFITLILLLALPAGAIQAEVRLAVSSCEQLLLDEKFEIEVIREKLFADTKNPQAALKGWAVSADDLVFKDILGGGIQGTVYLVERNGKLYALKLFRDQHLWLFNSTTIIQKYLGDLGMAPKIYGVLNYREVKNFIGRFGEQMGYAHENNLFVAGVLMELTSIRFLKTASEEGIFNRVQVTPNQRSALRAQALRYLQILQELNIKAIDVDAVVDSDGRLLLVDFGLYKVIDPDDKNRPYIWLEPTRESQSLLFFIDNGTTTLRARWNNFKSYFGFDKDKNFFKRNGG